jgi:hypothetical protein
MASGQSVIYVSNLPYEAHEAVVQQAFEDEQFAVVSKLLCLSCGTALLQWSSSACASTCIMESPRCCRDSHIPACMVLCCILAAAGAILSRITARQSRCCSAGSTLLQDCYTAAATAFALASASCVCTYLRGLRMYVLPLCPAGQCAAAEEGILQPLPQLWPCMCHTCTAQRCRTLLRRHGWQTNLWPPHDCAPGQVCIR